MITIFISMTVLVVIITSIIFMYLFSNYAYSEKRNLMVSCANDIARLVSEEITKPAYNQRSYADYSMLVTSVLNAKVWIVDTAGIFKTMKNSSWPVHIQQLTTPESNIIKNTFMGKGIITEDFSVTFGEATMSVSVPIKTINSNTTIGAVLIHSPMKNINESFMTAQALLAIAVIVAVIISTFVAITLSLRFTRPLKSMCLAASQMAKGNYNVRTQLNDKSELSELSYSLNYLASTLESSVTKLKIEKDKLNSIIENVSDGLAAFDTNLILIKYNAALLKLCTQEHFDTPKVKDAIMQVMQTGERGIVVVEDKDILRFTITRIKNEGVVEGVVVIVQDISQSERLEKLRREFVANVSHEFRTPLTIIKGSVEALIDGAIQSEEDKKNYYNRIENETGALERLVKDLLDTSRFKAGKITLDLKKEDITKILYDLRENLSTIAADKNIKILYKETPLPDVLGDHDRLRQLFIIFIDNAIKFTPIDGTITLSTEIIDNMACVNIKDTGVGISEEDIPFIFERFYKVDKARGGSETGTGLGLSIAWQIAELHGGTILVESQRGKGTLFKILLPIYKIVDDKDKDKEKSNNINLL